MALIEWPERAPQMLPTDRIDIALSHRPSLGTGARAAEITGSSGDLTLRAQIDCDRGQTQEALGRGAEAATMLERWIDAPGTPAVAAVHCLQMRGAIAANMQDGKVEITNRDITTIVVPPDFDLKCDEFNNYLMYPKGEKLPALIKRLSNAGLGYLLAPRVLEEARAKRAG